jgi:hypothetical protein
MVLVGARSVCEQFSADEETFTSSQIVTHHVDRSGAAL